jgi:thioredoxin reductase
MQRQLEYVVVGNSIPGVVAAFWLRKRGFSVGLLELASDSAALESILEVPLTPIRNQRLSGEDFAVAARDELASAGVVTGTAVATGIRLPSGPTRHIVVETSEGQLTAERVVYSPAGIESGLPWIAGLENLYGRGVSMDAWSDAPSFERHAVAIIGSGRRAAEQALIARAAGTSPIILSPFAQFDRSGLSDQLLANAIDVQEGEAVVEVTTDVSGYVAGVKTMNAGGREQVVSVAAVFLAQGLVCDWTIFEGLHREVIHPAVMTVGVAAGVKYWDYVAQVAQAKDIADGLSKS